MIRQKNKKFVFFKVSVSFNQIDDDGSIGDRSMPVCKSPTNVTKKHKTEPMISASPEVVHSNSSQDIFSTENIEQVKDVIMNDVFHGINRTYSGAHSENSTNDNGTKKSDCIDLSSIQIDRKPTTLLVGPKFLSHTIESKHSLKQKIIYPMSVCKTFCFHSIKFHLLISVLLV